MNRNIGVLAVLFTLITLVTVGCGGAQTTPNVDATVAARVQAANVESTVEARVQATLAANGQPSAEVSTETPSLVLPATTPEVSDAQLAAELGIGSKQVSDKDGMTLLYVPAGEFTMGSNTGEANEQPEHIVYLDAFWIDQTEVTNAMYAKCVNAGNCRLPSKENTYQYEYGVPEFDSHPVTHVSWNNATAYCRWAGRDLPTEAQWEKAARGDDKRVYPWGNELPDSQRLNFHLYNNGTTEVGEYPSGASPYGAYDMAGNVAEWVKDWYAESYYASSPSRNPENTTPSLARAGRGGGFANEADAVRASIRFEDKPEESGSVQTGFRCAQSELPSESAAPVPAQPAIATQAPALPKLGIGSSQVSDKDGMTLLYVPAGEFKMGAADSDASASFEEKPQHTVYLDAFWIDQTEVTNAMYAKCVKAGVCQAPKSTESETRDSYYGNPEFDNYPVTYVGWEDAEQYCTWADRSLPTEAQWEKAARGDDQRIYPWGNEPLSTIRLNFKQEVDDSTEVGTYPGGASPYGALDMAGNMWEWVADRYDKKYYASSPVKNPTGPSSGDYHVMRGGGWGGEAAWVRVTYRFSILPHYRSIGSGFRCAQSESPSASAAHAPAQSTVVTQAPASPSLEIGSTQVSDKDGMTLLYVPAGEFTMGYNAGGANERPEHQVYLDAFWIDQTEVTNVRYAKCVAAGACRAPAATKSYTHDSYYGNPQFDDYPVVYVAWNDAKQYCEWAGRHLPTEAQWEKAARGTDGRIYPWGDQAPDKTRLNYNMGVGDTTQVGAYPTDASPYGAVDMAGNAAEWIADWYDDRYYASLPDRNPAGPSSGSVRIMRGGAWGSGGSDVLPSSRTGFPPNDRYSYMGFRCAKSESPSASAAPAPAQPAVVTQAPASPNLGIGATQVSTTDGMTLLYVPTGEFTMGSNVGEAIEQPEHTVYLDAFWIDRIEVTNAMYAQCVKAGACQAPTFIKSAMRERYYGNAQFDNYPVVYVSWNDAAAYCRWAGRDLPTEAQWEKAARGSDKRVYPWGNESPITNRLNFHREVGDTTEVGTYSSGASPYGALNLAGNVWEWVADWYDERYYASSPNLNPTGPNSGQDRVLRGGSWGSGASFVRTSNRYWDSPVSRGDSVGFRCVR